MHVVVTGAAGQIGTILVQRLAHDRNIETITAIDLKPVSVQSPKVCSTIVDVRDPELHTHFGSPTCVVHLAFVVAGWRPSQEFASINVQGSRNVFAAAAATGAEQIVHLSSMAAYGVVDGHPEPIVEDTSPVRQATFPYSAAKFDVERALERFGAEHPDIRIAVLRPAFVLGRDVRHPVRVLLKRRLVAEIHPVPVSVVWDEDVAAAIESAMRKRAAGAFNLVADDPLSPREIADTTGWRYHRVPRPLLPVLVTGLKVLARLRLWTSLDPAWLSETNARMVVSSEKAKHELDWTPKFPTTEKVFREHQRVTSGRRDWRMLFFLVLTGLMARGKAMEQAMRGVRLDTLLLLHGPARSEALLRIRDGRLRVRPGRPESTADCTISMESSLFRQMLVGERDWFGAQLSGQIRRSGDSSALMVMAGLVAAIRARSAERGISGRIAKRFVRWAARERETGQP